MLNAFSDRARSRKVMVGAVERALSCCIEGPRG
jgi:hypothetical protein